MPISLSKNLLLVLLLIISSSACKKADNNGSGYTAGMGGVRKWHGHYYYSASGIHFTTPVFQSYDHPDTSFALKVIDNTTIEFMGTTYPYSSTDDVNGVYYFGSAYYYYMYGAGSGIAYYYAKDSIVYCNGDRHATSDQWTLSDLRYTYK